MSGIQAPPGWQTDPAGLRRIGVATDRYLYVFDHLPPRGHEVDGGSVVPLAVDLALDELCEIALDLRLGALWLLRQDGASPPRGGWNIPALTRFDEQARELLAAPPAGLSVGPISTERGRVLAGLRVRLRGADGRESGPIVYVYATWTHAWPVLGHLPDGHPQVRASLLSAGVRLASYQLGAQLRSSPTYTGRALLRQSLAAKSYDLTSAGLSPEAYELVTAHLPHPVQWCGPIGEYPGNIPAAMYKYDRNASYLASAAACAVPTGDPVPTEQYQPGCPGFYRVEARPPADWPANLPGPFHVGEGAGSYPAAWSMTWAWEPIIRLALRHGWEVTSHGGYYWPRSVCHQSYKSWAGAIWQAREACKRHGGIPGDLAAAICKQCGVATIGGIKQHRGRALMSAKQARAEGLEILEPVYDEARRPTGDVAVEAPMGRYDIDWPHHWGHIIATADERLLEAVYAAREYHPTAAYVDAVYCTSEWPTEAIEPDRLGKWKLESVTPIGPGWAAELDASESAEAWVKRLAAIRREGTGDE